MDQDIAHNSRNFPGKQSNIHQTREKRAIGPTLTVNSDERECSLDSGASVHLINKTDLSPEELETVEVSRLHMTVFSVNGPIDATEESKVYVKDLDIFRHEPTA